MIQDIRWQQRFNNLKEAFSQLSEAFEMKSYSNIERQGLIKAFEFTYELAWNTLKDILEEQGYTDIKEPKDTIQQSLKLA
jgi:nucleotidyltransferase substrate binding protein (TIGR01987 family)